MTQVFVGIGSNIDREANIRGGLHALAEVFGELTVSSIYESKAYGFDGENFYNLVAGFQTEISAGEVASKLREIEFEFGRQHNEERFSSRTLDIDLLLYGDLVCHKEHLQIPREDIIKYSFVLCPLAELAPQTKHPEIQESYTKLWQDFNGDKDNLWKVDFNPG